MTYEAIDIHTDGGARGNPGPSAVGVVIESITRESREVLVSFGQRIADGTNNEAEYKALIAAFDWLLKHQITGKKVVVHLDSALIIGQVSGKFKITKDHLRSLCQQVKTLERQVGESFTYTLIPRIQNAQADRLVNQALDGHI